MTPRLLAMVCLGSLAGCALDSTSGTSTDPGSDSGSDAIDAGNSAGGSDGLGQMTPDIALVYDWCNTQVTSSQKTRWLKYADQAVSNVWHNTTAKWGTKSFPWTGWATDDPSDNYYYSFLRATMLLGLATLGEDTNAQG